MNFTAIQAAIRSRAHQIYKVMKLTTFLLIIALVQASAKGFSQKITLHETKAPLEKVITTIKQQSGYEFLYLDQDLKKETITVQVNNASIDDALKACFTNTDVDYKIVGNNIVLKKTEPNFLDKLKNQIKAELAQVAVTGKVTDEQGNPMIGVTIKIKDTQQATATDKNGVYSITVPNDNTVIVFSFIGFESQELRARDISSGSTIMLKATATNLHEVYINKGPYTEKEELSTSSTSRVTAKEIEQQPVTNILQALEGRVPGLQITQLNGQPGGGFTVQIRGQNSIRQGNNPYYIIDGVPFDSTLPTTSSGNGLLNNSLDKGNPLNFINPYDIESVEVLKDADATAIYGSRGANGVILIKTKSGKAGPMRADVTFNSGFSSQARSLPVMNTQQYIMMRQEAFKNDGALPVSSDHDINGDWDMNSYTNWQKVLTQNPAPYLNAQASVSGGNTNTQYIASTDYYRQSTPFPTQIAGDGADQKASFHLGLNTTSSDQKLKITFNGSYVSDKNTVQSADLSGSRLLPPNAPEIFNSNGTLNWAPLIPGQAGTWTNPYAGLYVGYKGNTSSLVAHTVLSYQILKNLTVSTSIGYTNTQTDEVQTTPTISMDPGTNPTSGSSKFNEINSHSFNIEPQINYNLNIKNGRLNTLLGGTFQSNNAFVNQLNSSNFSSDAVLANPQAAGTTTIGSNATQYKYESVYVRLGYTLEDKYLINLTARRDGSSRFGPASQFGNFGSIGAGWVFGKEKFIEDNFPILSFGKIRGSYAVTGSDQIPDYSFIELYSITGSPYNGVKGTYPSGILNPSLAWEIDKKLDGGIELGFFNNRINISASFYRNRSNNQLLPTPLPSVTGFGTINSNLPASVENTGQEYVLQTINIKSGSFNWQSSFNITLNRNKLISFPGLSTSTYSSQLVIGEPLTVIKAFKMIGVNPATGLYQFENASGQLTYNPNSAVDKISYINTNPQFFGGFGNTFDYKGFSLNFLFQFVKQTGKNLFSGSIMPGKFGSNQPLDFLNHWEKPGDQAKYELYTQSQSGSNQAYRDFIYAQQSDFSYSDASFIRLKTLHFSWTLPLQLDKALHFQSGQLFIEGQNLLTFTNYIGIDPETQAFTLPPMRIFTLGFDVRF
ncbi:SusC/RagA family TonB-linked outer membrane protein [Mucilaginibacter sp. dw_454]|uniref:SusC/RagA family TonB-linked outer membrane protein n=1 Tax=Mucilaginibacter sp. dw_454 TaxID=2720079 RepID=UPI001BD61A2F|nr:SusC/RagA family TonB-linked outer membrane protein [Mucilaginibacter sp. dw_454]